MTPPYYLCENWSLTRDSLLCVDLFVLIAARVRFRTSHAARSYSPCPCLLTCSCLAPMPPKIKRVGKYELGATLGVGSHGRVKLCRDITNNNTYAIKMMDKERIRQARMGAQIKKEVRNIYLAQTKSCTFKIESGFREHAYVFSCLIFSSLCCVCATLCRSV